MNPPPWFDRSDLLAFLKKRVDGFQAGYRQNLALIGPSGRGKSTLIRKFLEEIPPASLLLPIYLEVGPEENVSEWIFRFTRTVLYSVLRLTQTDVFPTRLPELLEASGELVPRTAALCRRIVSWAESGRLDEAYEHLWELSHLLTLETGHRVLLVLDEFHRLRGFSLKEPFRSLGRRIMVQPTTLYLVTSSEPAAAYAILREGLALLFGKFESIEVPPLGVAACRQAIRAVGSGDPMDPWVESLLLDLAQGRPHRLNLLLEALARHAQDSKPADPTRVLPDLLETLFLDPGSELRREFERRLRLLPAHRNRMFCLQLLEMIASGVHRLPDLAEASQKPVSQVVGALRLLEEERLVKREGVFHRIPERLFQAWLITAHPTLQGVALMGPAQARAHFRRTADLWMERVRQSAHQPVEERVRRLLLEWRDERVELDGRKVLLPKFREVEPVPGPLERQSLLGRPATRQKRGWWVVPWTGALDEGQARQLAQQVRGFAPLKEYWKVLVGASPAEVNARLVLQEAKIRFWDRVALNHLLDLYGLERLPVPEETEEPSASMVPLEESPLSFGSEEQSSEVAG